MGRMIVTALLVVAVAVLVSMNLGFTTSVNLFGSKLDNVSVVAVAALSFALGVIYSFIISIGKSLRRRTMRGLADRDRHLAVREKELSSRQTDADRLASSSEAPEKKLARSGHPGLSRFFKLFQTRDTAN